MKKKLRLYILIILGITFSLSIHLNNNFSFTSINKRINSYAYEDLTVKRAGFWDLTGSPIFIDDSDPDYNWSKTATDNDWCNGLGTWNDPYIIENVTIDGQDSDSCITITDSNKYFIIRNCTFYNSTSGTGWNHAGIRLNNVRNGRILNNNCSSNKGGGIYLANNSNNNTVIGNIISNDRWGIFLDESNFNNISRNNVSESTWSNGIYLWYSHNNTIFKNNASKNGLINMVVVGIRLDFSNDNNISNNIADENAGGGINLGYSNNNTIERNIACNNLLGGGNGPGISLFRSDNNILLKNNASDNPRIGIYLSESKNNTISWNNITNNDEEGIKLSNSRNNTLAKNNVSENEENGMFLEESHNNNVSGNFLKDNSGCGIELDESDNNTLLNNTLYLNNYGIWLDYSDNNTLIENNVTESNTDGIRLSGSSNNKILKNIANNNGVYVSPSSGIHLFVGSNSNNISENIVNENSGHGIELSQSYDNMVKENNATNNQENGIHITESHNNTILHNNVKENVNGVLIRGLSGSSPSSINNISENTIYNNSVGINLEQYCYNNTFVGNDIINNTQRGVFLEVSCENNLFYENYFINNSLHAFNDGINNYWNNSVIGNYWDNYTGFDANDDGIGDTPYTYIAGLAGGQDNYPIFEDGDDLAPIISINLPTQNELFGSNSPTFNITIIEFYLNTTWYTLDGGTTNKTFIGLTGIINQALWDTRPNGTVIITFYVNDSVGRLDSDSVIIYKDNKAPNITIINPIENQKIGINSPQYNLTIVEGNLDSLWYLLDNGTITTINITVSSLIGYINQTLWDYFVDGILTIKFYANDTEGNLGSEEVNVLKDIHIPIISIDSPKNNDLFGNNTPSFNVSITDVDLDTMWYTLNNGTLKYIFITNGTINQTAWISLADGIINITFCANNTLGNLATEEVNILKDSHVPIITIISPHTNDVFNSSAPSFIVNITDENLDTMWYTLNSGTAKYTFTTNGTIDPSAWSSLSEGNVVITFYANDTLDNLAFEEVIILKDSHAPIIIIISPHANDVFNNSAPSFIVNITDKNLDTMWYTLNGGTAKYIFTTNGTIDQSAWSSLSEGNVAITFYANDTLGNLAFEEISITKSITQPNGDDVGMFIIIVVIIVISAASVISAFVIILIKKRSKLET